MKDECEVKVQTHEKYSETWRNGKGKSKCDICKVIKKKWMEKES